MLEPLKVSSNAQTRSNPSVLLLHIDSETVCFATMSEKKTKARKGGPLIIGTGLPRTGTTSLCEALETLGFAPCHHFRGMVARDPFPYRDSRLWSKAAKTVDKDARQDMLHFLLTKPGCKAAVDYPTSCFIDDMVEMYPNAKVHIEPLLSCLNMSAKVA